MSTVPPQDRAVKETGLYTGVPYPVYHTWDGASAHVLRTFRRTPAHALEEMLHPSKPTVAKDFGHALHVALLEPEIFETEYGVPPKVDRRYKAGKRLWQEWEATHVGMRALSQEDMDKIRRMQEAAFKHALARQLLSGDGLNEVCAAWPDRELKVPCKGRMDRITDSLGFPSVIDVKTIEDASKREAEKAIYYYAYHEQAAFYVDGLESIEISRGQQPSERKFYFVFMEKEAPYLPAVYEIEPAALEQGRDDYRAHLQAYTQCRETGIWPGYPEEITWAGLPPWAYRPGGG